MSSPNPESLICPATELPCQFVDYCVMRKKTMRRSIDSITPQGIDPASLPPEAITALTSNFCSDKALEDLAELSANEETESSLKVAAGNLALGIATGRIKGCHTYHANIH